MSGPYVVALTRWARPLEEELAPLAELLAMVPYDLRMRLAGPLPVVVSRTTVAAEARQLLAELRGRGHGAVACDLCAVASSGEMLCPKTFALGAEELTCAAPGSPEIRVRFDEVLAVVVAMLTLAQETTTRGQTTKLSLGRAALTGGLMVTKTVETEKRHRDEKRERAAYVFRRSGCDSILLREHRLRYEGLGQRMGRTSAASFSTLLAALRERAPAALYDERLVSQRRAVATSLSGTRAASMESRSNAGAMDLAAHLITVAHLRDQL